MGVRGPSNPEVHGEFMAVCYEISPELGQLAVSYVLCHYYTGAGGFRYWPQELGATDMQTLEMLADGSTPVEAAQRCGGVEPEAIRARRSRLCVRLGVTGSVSAVRRGIEEGFLQVTPKGHPDLPMNPHDSVAFDLVTRGLTRAEVSKITGDSEQTISRYRCGRIADALKVPRNRRGLAVARMYEVGLFRQGLGLVSSLNNHPEIVRNFDRQLGRNPSSEASDPPNNLKSHNR